MTEITIELNALTIPIYTLFVLSIIEVIRTWGVTTRPLSFGILVLVILQLLWLWGVLPLPGASGFQDVNVWLAIVDAAIIPMSVALAYMAAGRITNPLASLIGLVALVHFLIVTGIVNVTGLV